MKQAIQFGAGNIGRGFIGLLLSQSGYKVTFVDVNRTLIDELNREQTYTVEVLGRKWAEIPVTPVCGFVSSDESLLDVFLSAKIITTAVGPNVLQHIAPIIAAGLEKRFVAQIHEYLTIIACENMVGGSSQLESLVLNHLSPECRSYCTSWVGFPDAAVDRIIPPGEPFDDLLRVRVEEFSEWVVDKGALKGPDPEIQGMDLVDNLPAYLERKLFTLNTGHAALAYWGARKRYRTIGETIRDKEIRDLVKAAMEESGQVLIQRYQFDPESHNRYIEKILLRFSNPALIDEVDRVARQPLRKLGYDERFMKPIRGTLEFGLPNDNLIKAASAALVYRNPDDDQCKQVEELVAQPNLLRALQTITGLGSTDDEEMVLQKLARSFEELSMNILMENYMRRWTHVVSLAEAEKTLVDLIGEALSGKEVILAHRGFPMVRLTPIGNQGASLLGI